MREKKNKNKNILGQRSDVSGSKSQGNRSSEGAAH
jgi:hypothetical protein